MSAIYYLYPDHDTSLNQGAPVPANPSTHFSKVAELVQDGDTTKLTFSAPGAERFTWDASVIADGAVVQTVALRVSQKKGGGAGPYTYRVGLVTDDDVEHLLAPASMAEGFGSADLALDPSLVGASAWTPALLASCRPIFRVTALDNNLPRPALSQLIGVVTALLPVRGVRSTPRSRAVRGTVVGLAPRSTARQSGG